MTMKRLPLIFALFICMLSICACTMTGTKKASEEEINAKKAEFEKYLEETYPDETFTVKIWQVYGESTGGAGLPDYKGYMWRQVITDSKGNRFRIYTSDEGSSLFNIHRVYSDDYQDVLDGKKYYNEDGMRVYFDENGEVLFISDQ